MKPSEKQFFDIREIQNKGCETDLEINEQLANEMLELEKSLASCASIKLCYNRNEP